MERFRQPLPGAGRVYAQNELTDPRRVVTATVSGNSTLMPRIPVRTSEALPKRHIDALLNRSTGSKSKFRSKRAKS